MLPSMLPPRAQRWLKALHELLAAVLIGSTAALAALVWLRPDLPAGRDPFALDLAVYWLFAYPLTWAFYGLLATGLTFSLFTNWGVLRWRWVTLKWLAFAALFAAAWVALGPAVHGLVGLSDAGLADPTARAAHAVHGRAAGGWAAVFLAVLAAIVPLSVLKPWGRWGLRRTLPRPFALALAALLVLGLGGLGGLQAWTLHRIRALPVPPSALDGAPDGTYDGAVELGGARTAVRVTLRGERIVAVQVRENRDSPFARLAEGVLPRIVARQRADVDVITGATTTSRALQLAVAAALSQAAPSAAGPSLPPPCPAVEPPAAAVPPASNGAPHAPPVPETEGVLAGCRRTE